MDQEIAERIAMALEGIEQAVAEQAKNQALVLEEQRRWIAEQRKAQEQMARRLGMVAGSPIVT